MSTFKASDLKRAAKAIQELGLPIAGAEIRPDGSILILTEAPRAAPITKDPYDEWKRKRGKAA
ncbi:hypothetical protein Q1W73_16670 [Asticcacaulis sp. ZE23SCel15]|uniref:hypothetical protein n=1 Tax=Asticcacaulis sp. ZE23SCel15 TaxID=3059027 RepID=UPI00265E4716|nr:hypothetical protein [Asticcacaulis sp. ZE23SCel15]WKL57278.1 hypothetical protein Q1W73_16670 [Asticcacaulis sp. ZE23SCel15]